MALSRRRFLAAGGGIAVLGAGGLVAVRRLDDPETADDWGIPAVPAGTVRFEQVDSVRRGSTVDLFTAVPAGHGDGAGLPVCLVLHGASGRPADYSTFGLPQFLAAAVRGGAPPFVLAGADGGSQSWSPVGADDPQGMLLEEMPGWLTERGFDVTRLAAWGWSMGGYGALRLAQVAPGRLRAVAVFSPAVRPDDAVTADAEALGGTPVGVWCGTEDPFYPAVRSLVDSLPEPLAAGAYARGAGHTRTYLSSITLEAFGFLGSHLV